MKRIIYLFWVLMLFSIHQASSQVTIGLDKEPDENALLDLKQHEDGTSEKGLLIPRLKLTESTDSSPLTSFVEGLIIYNIESVNDVEPGFYYCDGSRWILLKPSDDVEIPSEPWLVTGTGKQATSVTDNMYHTGDVVIGRSGDADTSAGLEVYSGTKGFLMPRLSQVQRDAISNPTESLIIWNIDEGCFNFYAQNAWKSMCGDTQYEESTVIVNCDSIKIRGVYEAGKPLDSSNYVTVTVQISGASNLRLEGVTDDGFYFQRIGRVPTAGTYTYDIPAFGTPRNSGSIPTTFNMYNNGKLINVCNSLITVEATTAEFKFNEVVTPIDDLIAKMPSSGKTITVKIDVTQKGIFNFYSNTLDGVQYTTNNISLEVGTHSITLYANGTPSKVETLNFTLNGSGSTNTLPVTVNVKGLIADATFNCDDDNIKPVGSYVLKTATTKANYIECTVDFTSLGTWSGSTDAVDGLSFDGTGNVTKTGLQTIRLYAKGEAESLGNKTFTIDINGAKCSVSIPILVPPKNILFIGKISSAVSTALMDLKNFGPDGTSKIANIKIIDGGNNPSAATLVDLINTNKIDIILAGWNFNCQDQAAQVIANFIKDKKGYYFQVQSQGRGTNLKLILDKAYGTNVIFTGDGYPLRAAQFPTIDHPILNGSFGDCRGKYVRVDDNNSWLGIVPTSSGSLNSFITLGEYKNNAEREIFTYADGFFMIPDWGTLNYTSSTYGSNSPIGPSTSDFTNTTVWSGGAYNDRFTIIAGKTVNWILFGNAMDNIFSYTEKYTLKDYTLTVPQ